MDCGIYKIANILTNDLYIGSSVNISKRFHAHKSKLLSNKHENIHLQRAINKYGMDNFIFEIIEYVQNKNDLIPREQYYLDILHPKYNIRTVADSNIGISKPKTKKWRENLSKSHSGKKHSEAHIKNFINSRSTDFVLKAPNGKIYKGKNISEFCKKHNLFSSAIYQVRLGNRKSHKGWTLP